MCVFWDFFSPATAAELLLEKKDIKNPAERGKKYELACQPKFEKRRLAPVNGENQTIDIILPNTIHACRKKNIS